MRLADSNNSGTITNKSIQILAFAQDVDIIAMSKRILTLTFEEVTKNLVLQINPEKTKYLDLVTFLKNERRRCIAPVQRYETMVLGNK